MSRVGADAVTLEAVCASMLAERERDGQAARFVEDATDAEALRALLRLDTRDGSVRSRTAWMDGAVVVARTDAALWNEDVETMRRKLTPREPHSVL